MEYIIKAGESLNKYNSILKAEDIVFVEPGEYGKVLVVVSGVIYKSLEPKKASVTEFWFEDNVAYVQIEDFATAKINMIRNNPYNKILKNLITAMNFGGERNLIEGNEFCNSSGHGLHHGGEVAGINTIIKNNLFHDNGLHGYGAVGGKGEKVIGNIFCRNGRTGIFYGTSTPENILIQGNLVFKNNQNGEGYPEIWAKGIGAVVCNNTGYSETNNRVFHLIEGSGVMAKKNIGYSLNGIVVQIGKDGISDYNCWFNPNNINCIRRGWDIPISLMGFQSYGQDLHSISQDPKFVDIANNDYRLQADSPCINAGDDGKNIGYWQNGGGQPMWNITGVDFVAVEQKGSISGKVTIAGVGLEGVKIEAIGPATISTTTVADGSYVLSDVIAGNYNVTASKTGYIITPTTQIVYVGA